MLPIVVSVADRKVVIVGRGLAGQQRLEFVHGSGAQRISLFAIDQDGWACHAEAALHERYPDEDDFKGASIVFIAGLPFDESQRLAKMATNAGALVNVEDVPELCDFHVPALVRRGDLLLTISTGGTAPGLAQKLKAHLKEQFGPEWKGHIERVAEARQQWRSQGVPKAEISRLTAQLIDDEAWLQRRVEA
jgi:precorrin-2 dehydrogenase/sirohydrochlorin ferrochelatase